MKSLLAVVFIALISSLPAFAQEEIPQDQSVVDVYYFHGTRRCATCKAVESETMKVLNENFNKEMEQGAIKIHVLNLELEENEKLVEKFEIGWSSLILYNSAKDEMLDLTKDGFAYARTQPEKFREDLDVAIRELQ